MNKILKIVLICFVLLTNQVNSATCGTMIDESELPIVPFQFNVGIGTFLIQRIDIYELIIPQTKGVKVDFVTKIVYKENTPFVESWTWKRCTPGKVCLSSNGLYRITNTGEQIKQVKISGKNAHLESKLGRLESVDINPKEISQFTINHNFDINSVLQQANTSAKNIHFSVSSFLENKTRPNIKKIEYVNKIWNEQALESKSYYKYWNKKFIGVLTSDKNGSIVPTLLTKPSDRFDSSRTFIIVYKL